MQFLLLTGLGKTIQTGGNVGAAKIKIEVRPMQIIRGTVVYVDVESGDPDMRSHIAKRPDEIAVIFDKKLLDQMLPSAQAKNDFWRWLTLEVYHALEKEE